MPAVTPTVRKTPEGNMSDPLSDARFFRYSFAGVDNGDTFDEGLPGIVDHAIKYTSGGDVRATNVGSGFLFSCDSAATFDLLVWAKG